MLASSNLLYRGEKFTCGKFALNFVKLIIIFHTDESATEIYIEIIKTVEHDVEKKEVMAKQHLDKYSAIPAQKNVAGKLPFAKYLRDVFDDRKEVMEKRFRLLLNWNVLSNTLNQT
jgi:hypothetical protein